MPSELTSEMITLAALLSTSQMLENSVPNSSVLVTQYCMQSEKQDSEFAAC